MKLTPLTITAEVLRHADGRPIAYIDATAIAVFVHQQPDGSHLISIYTRHDSAEDQIQILLDETPVTPLHQPPRTPSQPGRRTRRPLRCQPKPARRPRRHPPERSLP
jgi:hypothetical protein